MDYKKMRVKKQYSQLMVFVPHIGEYLRRLLILIIFSILAIIVLGVTTKSPVIIVSVFVVLLAIHIYMVGLGRPKDYNS